jgi:predicted Fe-Mo cluster-binding NifX family protein
MELSFAFALNNNSVFEEKHFGESDKFVIYNEKGQLILLQEEIDNSFKSLDENQIHGSQKKGSAIISFLKEKKVNVLVSKQFGKNIRMVNKHFVPIIIQEDSPNDVLRILQKHKKWIKDELMNRQTDHMLFYIKNGILKLKVKDDKLK